MEAPSTRTHMTKTMDSHRDTLSARLQIPRLARSLSFTAPPWKRRTQAEEPTAKYDAKHSGSAISQLVSSTIAFLVLTPPDTTPPAENEDQEFESLCRVNPKKALATRSLNLLRPKSVPNLRHAQKEQRPRKTLHVSTDNLKSLSGPLTHNASPILIVAPENMPLGHKVINLVGSREVGQNIDGTPVAPSPTLVGASLQTGHKQLSLHYASLYLSIQGAEPISHRTLPVHESPQISASIMPNLSPLRILQLIPDATSDALNDGSIITQFFTPATSPLAYESTQPSVAVSTPSPSFFSHPSTRNSVDQVLATDAETSVESTSVKEEVRARNDHDAEISREMPSASESDLIRDITADLDVFLMASPMGSRIQQTESIEFKGRRWDYLDKPTFGPALQEQPMFALSRCRALPSSSSILRPLTQADFDASFVEVFQVKRK